METTLPKLIPTDIQVLPDPARRWLDRQPRPNNWNGFWPATDSQGMALDNRADVLLFGGAAGSLKTATSLVSLIQERQWPRMMSYFFRRTFPAMEDAMVQARELFSQTGGTYTTSGENPHTWRWPSGAMFRFRQLDTQKDLDNNYGKQMSAIAFDESTHWEENFPRSILARNRSTDPDLKIRAIFTTNPGNRGHKWHMKLFMGGVCPHCEPQNAPKQGELRWDAQWPSDKRPLGDPDSGIKLSVAYILGNIRDHNLLGKDYVARLYMQRPNTAKALLAGCWRIFEGLYFDIWDPTKMVIKRREVADQWWWAHWTGSDYGYSGSAAASVLFCRTEPQPDWPNGRIIMLDEYPSDEMGARREPVRTFARGMYDKLIKKSDSQAQARRLEDHYLGVDSWNDRGDQHTLAGQMEEELEEQGVTYTKADNDRAGGAQLMYSQLASGEMLICDSCPNVIEAIESRLIDPAEPAKVLKVTNDPLDDYFDAARYGDYSYHQQNKKPAQMRVQEHLQKKFAENPTAAMFNALKIKEQEEADEQPAVYGGKARRILGSEQK